MEARIHSSTVEESAVVERVARIVSSVRSAKPDYTRLAAELGEAIPFDIFGVVLLRHDRQAVRVVVCQRGDGHWRASHHQHPMEGSKFEQILQDPPVNGLMVSDYPDGLDGLPSSSGDALSRFHQLRSTLIAPLMVEDRVLGTLELGSKHVGTYADQMLCRLVKAVVHVLATAIESAQFGGNIEIQDRQREALKTVSSSLASKMDLSTILDQVASGIARALNVSAAIFLFDPRKKQLSLQAQRGLDEVILHKLLSCGLLANDRCIIGQTLQLRQLHVSQDISIDERFPASITALPMLGMRSVSCYPLVTGATIYGVLLLGSPEPGGYTPLKAEILALFADQATIAIHNGMLMESAYQRSRFQQAIERLDLACRQRELEQASQPADVPQPSPASDESTLDETTRADLAMLTQVREETQRTFGVSFGSLLRFVGDHLLTSSERDLQAILYAYQEEQMATSGVNNVTVLADALNQPEPPATEYQSFETTLALLTQTAEEALERAGILGQFSRLLTQLQQSTSWVKAPWFVVNLSGVCLYMNGAGEDFCHLHLQRSIPAVYPSHVLGLSREANIPIVRAFENLYPQMRNAEGIRAYLQDFTQASTHQQEVRCILIPGASVDTRNNVLREQKSYTPSPQHNNVTDNHFQFIRYPLYNRQGQLEASALQIRDITQEVRNEHNMSTLLSSVSHDLRTPLTTIKAAVTGLLQEEVAWSEPDRIAMLEDIDSETDHLTVQVQSLIDLSRIEMGGLTLAREWCDVVEVWYGAGQKLEHVSGGRPIYMRARSHLPLIYVDHAQLERVFINLTENALRRSPEEQAVEVFIDSIENEEKVCVRIIDQGRAIPEAVREDLFVSFQNLRTYGNGLGLAICRGIIHAHHGQIWTEAVTDGNAKGAAFIFTLPAYKYTIERTRESAHSAPAWRGDPPPSLAYNTAGEKSQ